MIINEKQAKSLKCTCFVDNLFVSKTQLLLVFVFGDVVSRRAGNICSSTSKKIVTCLSEEESKTQLCLRNHKICANVKKQIFFVCTFGLFETLQEALKVSAS